MQSTRRHFLGMSVAGGSFLSLFGRLGHADPAVIPSVEEEHYRMLLEKFLEMGAKTTRTDASRGGITIAVGVRWLTDPERIARILPPPLEPDDEPVVAATWLIMTGSAGRERTMSPGPTYSESDVSVSAKYHGHRGMLSLQMNLERDMGRIWGREAEGLRKKDGTVYINRYGNTVRAHVARRGEIL